ncbi:hypothetical protein NE237_033142 [Protea cynaroides]|uniref:Trichome birefringence-like N-terminal domain-containing protein n=1 Tax=Protea cynaroides TaxID=273540 RepID=A0A9Q0R4F3_9MAGN|nr:hypothetical protein NE237_033142 [Protea cynaroides]
MGSWIHYCSSVAVLLLILLLHGANGCDYFKGSWVFDPSYPLYNSSSCSFIEKEFNCQNNGRPDSLYLKYRWKPSDCDLPRFDGLDFLRRNRGKRIMFVGDSLSLNQWKSLICLLHSAVPHAKFTIVNQPENHLTIFTFQDYGVSVMLSRNVYLVDLVSEKIGRVLKLDSVKETSKGWNNLDVLIFNTWHWWNRRGPTQPFDYFEVGNKIYKDMDRLAAFQIALNTWATWVDTNIDPTKTRVFFQGISPSHYNGTDWNEPGLKNCQGQKIPLNGNTYPGGLPPALTVLKRVLSSMSKPVYLLDVTELSLLRKDGHPSSYGLAGMDCSHWCLPGVPDTWNQLLYNALIH